MEWRLRRAGSGDAPALSLVAAATFLETFAGIIAGPDMVRHCTTNSSAAKFNGWTTDSACVVTLAEHPDGAAPVGYTLLVPPDLPIDTDARDIELRRIYALSQTRGTGLGHKLMTRAIDDARALGRRRMLLGVLGINARARAFYEREGFVLAGTRQFRVGDTVYDDVVYARGL
ncbi:GNAT family N-acetyltransferase [Sphingomonas sp.]|uniref:GNAT family N-acetyltransferase n=1 Tax=Sphingomonas sp. TaxID=28214 RepID=UPI0031DDDE2F